MPTTRILVTGAKGFVGRRLCRMLVRQYPDAKLLRLRQYGPSLPSSHWLVADVRDRATLLKAISHFMPDLVVHLAGQASVAASEQDRLSAWDVNVSGALAVASALNGAHCKANLLAVSSAEVYGLRFNEGPCNETTSPMPVSVYGRSKLAAEQLLSDVYEGRLIIVRPFNHTGPGQDERFVLPGFAAQVARMEIGLQAPALSVGNLAVWRDFLHVDDVLRAYCSLISHADKLPDRSTFVVASGVPVELSALIHIFQDHARTAFTVAPEVARMRPADIVTMAGDSSALRATTGWNPSCSTQDIVFDLLSYWRSRLRISGEPRRTGWAKM